MAIRGPRYVRKPASLILKKLLKRYKMSCVINCMNSGNYGTVYRKFSDPFQYMLFGDMLIISSLLEIPASELMCLMQGENAAEAKRIGQALEEKYRNVKTEESLGFDPDKL